MDPYCSNFCNLDVQVLAADFTVCALLSVLVHFKAKDQSLIDNVVSMFTYIHLHLDQLPYIYVTLRSSYAHSYYLHSSLSQ